MLTCGAAARCATGRYFNMEYAGLQKIEQGGRRSSGDEAAHVDLKVIQPNVGMM